MRQFPIDPGSDWAGWMYVIASTPAEIWDTFITCTFLASATCMSVWLLRLCLITHESGTGLVQTGSRFESVLALGFEFTARLVCNKTGFRFAVNKQGLIRQSYSDWCDDLDNQIHITSNITSSSNQFSWDPPTYTHQPSMQQKVPFSLISCSSSKDRLLQLCGVRLAHI